MTQQLYFNNLIDIHTDQMVRMSVPDDFSFQDLTEVGVQARAEAKEFKRRFRGGMKHHDSLGNHVSESGSRALA